jgi:acetyltransferase-like isoleucine patch superfamily enzyme
MHLRRSRRFVERARRRVHQELPYIATDDVVIGRNVRFGCNVRFECDSVRIGDGTAIRDNVTFEATHVAIGNYATIYDNCFFPGPGALTVGHNFWLGTGAIVDSKGGTVIGDHVGIGAGSQLWTHMTFGDTLYGSRWDRVGDLTVDDDVWFVGHCLVGPIHAGPRSLAMLGAVVTRNMEADHTYAGAPAVDVTEKFGPTFEIRPVEERLRLLNQRLDQLLPDRDERRQVLVVSDESDATDPDHLVLNVESRTYTANGHPLEQAVIRGLHPTAKFVPRRADT